MMKKETPKTKLKEIQDEYRIGRNDWGVKEQINLNRKYLSLPLWHKLATLLHEMVHSWEYTYIPHEKRTKNWYHTINFREKLAEFGIISNEKGQHIGLIPDGDFVFRLKQHDVSFAELPFTSMSDGAIVIDPSTKKKREAQS